jgi:hypothetical protein
MTTNAETALNYAVSLEHARIAGNGPGRPVNSAGDIIEDARKYQEFLDEGDGFDGYPSVFVLTSPTYKFQRDDGSPEQHDDVIVGLFASKESAESYRDNAVGPVTDGKITEWGVASEIVGPGGTIIDPEASSEE